MEEDIDNKLLFLTLDNIRPLASPKVSMWSMDDKYAHPPYLRFRFRDIPFDDEAYKKLEKIVGAFKGNVSWSMISNKEKTANYFILPTPFKDYVFTGGILVGRDSFVKENSNKAYEELIDKSLIDIPCLAKYIESNYP